MISHFRAPDVIIPLSEYFAEDNLMGKSYAISDIHAHMEPFEQFLDEIGPNDKVYVIGDVVDKGPDGLDVLFRILDDPRCILIIGNHDLMFLEQINCKRRSLYDRAAIELSEICRSETAGMSHGLLSSVFVFRIRTESTMLLQMLPYSERYASTDRTSSLYMPVRRDRKAMYS